MQEHQPHIKYKEGEYILILPSKMESALKNFDASFIHWKTKDYTSKILSDVKKENDSCRAPFALTVDINKDGGMDLILDGHDENNSLLISIISNKEDYKVLVIEKYSLLFPEDNKNFNEGKEEIGFNYYFWINKQNKENDSSMSPIFTKAYPQQTDSEGELLNDGVMIDYYYEDGKFISEVQTL
jgi:hypothetical protein